MQHQWKRPGTGKPKSPALEVGVRPPASRWLRKKSRKSGDGQAAAAEWISFFQQMPGGWGVERRGLLQGVYPAPLHPSPWYDFKILRSLS